MKLKITVHGVAYEVDVEVLDPGEEMTVPSAPLPQMQMPQSAPSAGPAPSAAPPRAPKGPAQNKPAMSGGDVTSPIAGTVVEVKCSPGQDVSEGDIIIIIEAMKMNTSIAAPASGKIKTIKVNKGDSVTEGQALVELE
ncbi:biotin/lipoyl-containing protein [Limisalsivibrio acetivorans]|uniref:biotin/lipoyl-containing protein n=1 Tax=Limisalsivibrio acetivorans TaxID=1304888 RepID=UPI0003B4E03E|nr:biotin/lipoyl-containing protein [Limisalsivibrio acetivorans]